MTIDGRYVADVARTSALVLICLLPFLALYSPAKNIEVQGLILIVAGGLGWLSVFITSRYAWLKRSRLLMVCMAMYLLSAIVSLVHSNVSYNFFGAPYVRLGAVGFIATIGCGLILLTLRIDQFIKAAYGLISILAITAIPYAMVVELPTERIGGIFAQATILAAFLGVGVLLGWELLLQTQKYRVHLATLQLVLFVTLLLTQTRFIIGAVIVLSIILLISQRAKLHKRIVIIICVAACSLIGGAALQANRLSNFSYAGESIQYRAALQQAGVQAFAQKPLGYGAGNIADALDCRTLTNSQLTQTCAEGYFFNGSHNIYLDRFLALGIVDGLAYLVLVIGSIWWSIRTYRIYPGIAASVLLIASYYVTNVTSIGLEVLFVALFLYVWRLATLDNARSTHRQ